MSKNNEAITPRDKDFAKWYTDVVKAAHLADYSSVKRAGEDYYYHHS